MIKVWTWGIRGENILIIITFTKSPETNLVEIMETDGTSNGIDEDGIGCCFEDYVGEVDGEEVCIVENGFVVCVPDECLLPELALLIQSIHWFLKFQFQRSRIQNTECRLKNITQFPLHLSYWGGCI